MLHVHKNTRVVMYMYMYMYIMKSMRIVSLICINFLDLCKFLSLQVIHAAQKKPLFTSFTTNARGLLLCTMQAATSVAKEMERDGRSKEKEKEDSPLPYDGDLHRPSLLPDSQVHIIMV